MVMVQWDDVVCWYNGMVWCDGTIGWCGVMVRLDGVVMVQCDGMV